MSNLVFTPPAGLGWSVFKTPNFRTLIQQSVSGKEVSSPLWQNPVWDFKLRWEHLRDSGGAPTALHQIVDFFLSRRGASESFLYQDPTDFTVSGQLIGYGDGSKKTFQLSRQFASGLYEPIFNPTLIQNIYVNNAVQSEFSYAAGIENLLLQSETLATAPWFTFHVTVTADQTTAPNGAVTADKVARADNTGSYLLIQDVPASTGAIPGEDVTLSLYVLQGTSGVQAQLELYFVNSAGLEIIPRIAGSPVTLTASWQRISLTARIPPGCDHIQVAIRLVNTSASGDFIYAWGAQLERFSVANQFGYIPTTSTILQPKGIVTFAAAPGSQLSVKADFNFMYRVRFKQDAMELENLMYQLWQLKTLELVTRKL